jgi:amidophosphoribosyltransferase
LGIDTPDRNQLMAAHNTLKQMQQKITCDYLGFLSLAGLIKTCGGKNNFCTGCFDGNYPIKPSKE